LPHVSSHFSSFISFAPQICGHRHVFVRNVAKIPAKKVKKSFGAMLYNKSGKGLCKCSKKERGQNGFSHHRAGSGCAYACFCVGTAFFPTRSYHRHFPFLPKEQRGSKRPPNHRGLYGSNADRNTWLSSGKLNSKEREKNPLAKFSKGQ